MSPVGAYFGGHGDKVMGDMMSKHGPEMGKKMFYSTANKKGMTPKKTKKGRAFKKSR